MWVLDQWRYFAHVMIMCISSRKAGKDAMGHDLAAAMIGLSLNRGYNFSRYIFKSLNDQINTAERFRFLLYPRFVQLLINDALPNLPATGERLQVKRVDKRVFAQFLKPGSVELTPEHTTLFGHLVNEVYVAPDDGRWFSHDSEPELSEHSDEQQEEEDVESVDESSEGGDEEAVIDGAEGSDSEDTESDSSDSDDAPSQRRRPQVTLDVAVTSITEEVPVIVTLPVPSVHVAIAALDNLEEGEIDSGDDWDEDDDVVIEIPKGGREGEYEFEDGEIFEVPSFESQLDTGSVETASNVEASTEASPADPTPVDPEAQKNKDMPASSSKDPAPVWQKTSIIDKHGATGMILAMRFEEDKYDLVNLANREPLGYSNHAVAMGLWQIQKWGEAVVIGKVWSDSGSLVLRELIRVFDEVYFINFSVKDLEALADRYCMHTDEWTKFLSSKYDKVIKFCLDYKKKMEAKDAEL
ncbi:hypothetical protein L1987_20381 [Smallanthus sonchifolius]|uniref:Uncharacterized protein n=1 Tax=Smallanthus sonchifolius TaxID=185202 RepID=A0ACB9IR67_9ASTR|nr:hypothetical protein L1987_20381 [Smallanthus sonchifolius]